MVFLVESRLFEKHDCCASMPGYTSVCKRFDTVGGGVQVVCLQSTMKKKKDEEETTHIIVYVK